MRKLLVIGLALALLGGCKKKTTKLAQGPPPAEQPAAPNGAAPAPGGGQGPAMHAPTGVALGSGGGGGGGAYQAVRQATTRVVNEAQMHDLQLFIDNASLASGQMPTAQEITDALQKESRKTYELVKDGSIVLTGTRSRENIWAYTHDPQTAGGEHLVLSASGIERVPAPTLKQRLMQQGP
jgi:hypothetical protein